MYTEIQRHQARRCLHCAHRNTAAASTEVSALCTQKYSNSKHGGVCILSTKIQRQQARRCLHCIHKNTATASKVSAFHKNTATASTEVSALHLQKYSDSKHGGVCIVSTEIQRQQARRCLHCIHRNTATANTEVTALCTQKYSDIKHGDVYTVSTKVQRQQARRCLCSSHSFTFHIST